MGRARPLSTASAVTSPPPLQGVRCIPPRPLFDTGFTHGIDLQLQLATLSHAELLHLVQG